MANRARGGGGPACARRPRACATVGRGARGVLTWRGARKVATRARAPCGVRGPASPPQPLRRVCVPTALRSYCIVQATVLQSFVLGACAGSLPSLSSSVGRVAPAPLTAT